MNPYDLSHVPDEPLLRNFEVIAIRDCRTTALLLAHIGEVEARKLYAPAGYHSMFAYCVGKLHMSEDIALKRIRVARRARRFPAIFTAIAEGRLHLSGAYLLGPHLTKRNAEGLFAATTHKSKREIELLLAQRFPQPDAPSFIRALPTAPVQALELSAAPVSQTVQVAPGPVASATDNEHATCVQRAPSAPTHFGRIIPVGPKRFRLAVNLRETSEEDVRAVQNLLAHRIPDRNLDEVTEVAYKIARAVLEKQKFAATERPRRVRKAAKEGSRYIPAHVRQAVWERDGGRCTFISKDGRRCDERGQLEFDHIQEFARGGEATIAGIRLLCRAHNQYAAELTYGTEFMREKREERVRKQG
jgi:5-methylcytosine-specific restriction endonuclease McrA